MKVKVLVAHSCPTLYDLMDCSLLGSSVHGIPRAIILEWVAIPSPGMFLIQKSNLDILHCKQIRYHMTHQG